MRRIEPRLRGPVRFEGRLVRRRIAIDAYYVIAPPAIPDFEITIEGTRITVTVTTHRLPPPPPLIGLTGTIVFTGVHPGAAIAVKIGASKRELGAICALLGPKNAATPTHLITCGHIFAPKAANTPVIAAKKKNAPEVEIGTLERNLLDRSTRRLDVALVTLTARGIEYAQISGPGPRLRGVLPASTIFNTASQTYRPTQGGNSAPTQTADDVINAHIVSTQWPNGFDVEGVIPTTISVSSPGDSGTILSTFAPVNAIGSCTASDGGRSLFEPLARALAALRDDYNLTLWSNP